MSTITIVKNLQLNSTIILEHDIIELSMSDVLANVMMSLHLFKKVAVPG
jgi:hypothetical protein